MFFKSELNNRIYKCQKLPTIFMVFLFLKDFLLKLTVFCLIRSYILTNTIRTALLTHFFF